MLDVERKNTVTITHSGAEFVLTMYRSGMSTNEAKEIAAATVTSPTG
jgi:hypothetical protein